MSQAGWKKVETRLALPRQVARPEPTGVGLLQPLKNLATRRFANHAIGRAVKRLSAWLTGGASISSASFLG